MSRVLDVIRRANPVALLSLAVIFAGLVAEGANGPARASLLSGALLLVLAASVIAIPRKSLARAASTNGVSGAAALAFSVLALATALPLPPLAARLAHPLAADFGWSQAAASISPSATLEGLAAFLAPAAAFALGALSSAEREARDWAGRWIALLTAAYAAYALHLYFVGPTLAEGRLDAGVGTANGAGALFGALALLSGALIVRAASGKLGARTEVPPVLRWAEGPIRAPIGAGAFALALACALLSASRGGLAATALGFSVFVGVLALRRQGPPEAARGYMFPSLVVVFAIAIWLLAVGGGPTAERLSNVAADAAGRRQLLEPHWEAFLSRPLLGNGLNTFHELNAMAATPENWSALRIAGAAHNIYVQALEEVGVVGVVLFALMIAPPLLAALRRALAGASGAEWSAALLGASALFLTHGAIDFALQIPAIAALFGFSLGAFSGSSGRARPVSGET